MGIHSRRVGRAIACSVLSFGLAAGSLTFASMAAAQTQIVDPNAPKANMSPHDAAIDAARRGDYIAAVDFAKKAAAAGQPLDADQVDYMTGKAAQQQAALDAAAKVKADQAAAAGTAEQIMERQQKDYAKRQQDAERKKRLAEDDQLTDAQRAAQGAILGSYAQSAGQAEALDTRSNNPNDQAPNAVNSTGFARNQTVSSVSNGARLADCVKFGKSPDGAATVASNKCGYKVVFLWCVDGGSSVGGDLACGPALPATRNEVDAHASLTLPQKTAGLKIKSWACASPGVPQTSSNATVECR
jgi:hypothetical protein